MRRQWQLVCAVEQAFLAQLRLELFVAPHQFADTRVFEVIDHQLVLATRFVKGDLGAQQHLLAVIGLEADAAITPAKHRRAALRLVVLQGEIPVAGGGARKVGNLALDPQGAEPTAEQGFDLEVERRNGPDGCVSDCAGGMLSFR